MFVSCFLASNDIFRKYFRDIGIFFFCVVVEFSTRLMSNLF